MLPRNHLLKFAPRRAAAALQRIADATWTAVGIAKVYALNESGTRSGPLSLPHHWGRLFGEQRFAIELPERSDAGSAEWWLRWQDQAESTLYIDGAPYFGFDVAHRECRLPSEAQELQIRACCVQSAIWHPGATGLDPRGSRLEGATLLKRSDSHWKLYHDLALLLELLIVVARRDFPESAAWTAKNGIMPDPRSVSPLCRKLLRDLDTAVDFLDHRDLEAMANFLDATYQSLPAERWALDATLTGHSHIDLVWLWPESVGELKAVHTFATVDYLMNAYPNFRFGYSQPASYEAVERREPKLFDQVKKRIGSGRWEAVGAMYVESDTLLPCGEALARSFEMGQKSFAKLDVRPSDALWLPDVFGYSGCLPQLMLHFGISRFFTNKLTWNDSIGFPYTSFRWIGTDGSAVLAHLHPETAQFYNGTSAVEEFDRAQNRHVQSDTHRELLVPTGYGDGGGGPTESMCERVHRLQDLATLPRCRWGSISGFFDRLEQIEEDLPTYHGEILLQFHRGVFASRSRFKRRYRALERELQRAETVAAVAGLGPVEERWWKRLIFCQFHDILPGSSIALAYEQLEAELDALQAEAAAFIAKALRSERTHAYFNPTPFPTSIRVGSTRLSLPPYRSRPISEAESFAATPIKATPQRLEGPSIAADFNPYGELASLSFRGRAIPILEPLNQIILYPNHPHSFAAWEIDRQALSLGERQRTEADANVSESPPGVAEVSFQRSIGQSSSACITYRYDSEKPYLEIRYEIDWQEPDALLKAVFPTGFRGEHARFGQPFGSAARRQNPRGLEEESAWETPASRWMLLSDDGEREGLSLITEHQYGCSVRYGTAGLSLLSSPLVTGEGSTYQKAMPNALRDSPAPSINADQGRHRFSLILAPWDGPNTPASQHPAALADYAFCPPIPCAAGDLRLPIHGISGCPSAYLTWIRPCPEPQQCIVRIAETMGARGNATLLLDEGCVATAIDGQGNPVGPPLPDATFAVEPFKFYTFRLANRLLK